MIIRKLSCFLDFRIKKNQKNKKFFKNIYISILDLIIIYNILKTLKKINSKQI